MFSHTRSFIFSTNMYIKCLLCASTIRALGTQSRENRPYIPVGGDRRQSENVKCMMYEMMIST